MKALDSCLCATILWPSKRARSPWLSYSAPSSYSTLSIHSEYLNVSFVLISLILRDFSLSSRSFYLEKGTLALPFDKNLKNLRELSYENKQNKHETHVILHRFVTPVFLDRKKHKAFLLKLFCEKCPEFSTGSFMRNDKLFLAPTYSSKNEQDNVSNGFQLSQLRFVIYSSFGFFTNFFELVLLLLLFGFLFKPLSFQKRGGFFFFQGEVVLKFAALL